MAIFGRDREQDERLDEIERHVRRLVEQVAQLSIDVSVTRVELRKVGMTTDALSEAMKGKIDLSAIDPVLDTFNSKLKTTRAALKEAREAADSDWETLQGDADQLLGDLNAAASRYTDGE